MMVLLLQNLSLLKILWLLSALSNANHIIRTSVAVHLAQSKISNTDASAGSSRTNHVASTCDLVSSPSFHIWIVDLGASAHVCCSRFLFL